MKKIDPGYTITVLANLSVFAGLIFLGIELRQNNEILVANAEATQLSIQRSTWEKLSEDPDIVALLVRDRNGESLNVEDEFRLNAFWMTVLLDNEWTYRTLPGNAKWIPGMRRNYEAYGSLRRTWQGGGAGSKTAGSDWFDPSFVQFFNENIVGPQ